MEARSLPAQEAAPDKIIRPVRKLRPRRVGILSGLSFRPIEVRPDSTSRETARDRGQNEAE